jgi:hypothetical protein
MTEEVMEFQIELERRHWWTRKVRHLVQTH